MIPIKTLNTMITNKHYDIVFLELTNKGRIRFNIRYKSGGHNFQVMGGEYQRQPWFAILVDNVIEQLELQ